MIGVGMWTEHSVQGRACVRPRENTILNPDGSMFLLTAGTRVEILEEADCVVGPAKPLRIRVIDQDVVGWLFGTVVRRE